MDKAADNLPLVVLVAMTDRAELHRSRTVPSLSGQSREWDSLYVIDDRDAVTGRVGGILAEAHLPGLVCLRNSRTKGAAGAWNTGLSSIAGRYQDAWVAILDDDDEWDAGHLELCVRFATSGCDAVVSGIAVEGVVYPPGYLTDPLRRRDFLSGNPGWQGSNTFVRLSRLLEVGGFDESLPCTHDRDLALRLMALEGFTVSRTGRRTVWYRVDPHVPAYSRRGNPEKLAGLRGFLAKHGHEMNGADRDRFLMRAEELFGFGPEEFNS